MRMRLVLSLLVCTLLVGCFATAPNRNQGSAIDQQPMYGGIDRNANPTLKAADEQLIEGVTKEFGNRENASQQFVEQGIRYYRNNQNQMAMKRFNQAWLLNPNNPEAFWGFAVVYYDAHKYCEAKKMVDRALELNLAKPIALADAGLNYSLCATTDKNISQEVKEQFFKKSEDLFKQADAAAPNNDYVLGFWATNYYLQGEYVRSWDMVTKARNAGWVFSGDFLQVLREKMPEPKPN